MANSNYTNGRVLEYAAKHALEAAGYFVVRAASSKGVADLVAIKRGEVRLVQCKLQGAAGQGELGALHAIARNLDVAAPLLVSWHKEGRAARQLLFREVFWSETAHKYRVWPDAWTPDYGFDPVPS